MDFNYTPEQEAYRMEVRGWLEANQPPPLRPEEKERADENFLWERLKLWHKKLYDGGWAGLTWPACSGGTGIGQMLSRHITGARVASMPGSPQAGRPTGFLWRSSAIAIAFSVMPRSSKRVP